jgi:hypothetical protein
MMMIVRKAACLILAACLALAIAASVRLALADYAFAQPELSSAERASRLEPESSRYWYRVAALREAEDPLDRKIAEALDRAMAVNPRDINARRLARGPMKSESELLEDARMNHLYPPAWALADFYFQRQDKIDSFWKYARKCVDIVEPGSYDLTALFDLAWQESGESDDEVRRRMIPPRHFVQADYLKYLTKNRRLDAAMPFARDLLAYHDSADRSILTALVQRMLEAGRVDDALAIWNALPQSEHLDPARGQSLTNGSLKRAFEPLGFDWRLTKVGGVASSHYPEDGEVRFEFSGDQREDCILLSQPVPVVAGASYRLTFRYRTSGMKSCDGLVWQSTSTLEPHEDWTAGAATFTVASNARLATLELAYHRKPGTTRIEGVAEFREFGLERLP